MNNDSKKSTAGKQIARNVVQILAVVFVLLGIVLLLVEGLFSKTQPPILQNILVNVGSGFLSAGILAFAFEKLTRESSWLVNEQMNDNVLRELRELLFGEEGVNSTIFKEIHRQSVESRTLLADMMRSMFADNIQKHVFANGLIGAFPLWAGRVPSDFIRSEQDLRIMLKDGFTFFSERKAELKERFRQRGFHTKILMLHPDYPFMAAVAQMDHVKSDNVRQQLQDCRFAIDTMQQIRAELLHESQGKIDIRQTVEFLGYSLVPTWTGFIGSSTSYVSLYFTRPYRGELNTLLIQKFDDRGRETPLYESMFREFEEIWRYLHPQKNASLFDYRFR